MASSRIRAATLGRRPSTPIPPIGCAYPFLATVEELALLGVNGRLTLSEGNQKGSYTIVGDLPSPPSSYAMGPAGLPAPSVFLDLSAGKRTIELALQAPALVEGESSDPGMVIVASFLTSDFLGSFVTTIQAGLDGTFSTSVSVNGEGRLSVAGSPPAVITFGLDAGTGKIKVKFDGIEQTLSADTYTPGNYWTAPTIQELSVPEENAGAVYSVHVRTAAADISHPFAGFGDACGNAIE